MKKISFSDMRCSLARSLEMIGDWWTPLIVRDIFLGVTRFDDLAEDLGISRNLLTRRLKHLVTNGVLVRQTYRTRPVRHDYRLTDAGADLIPAILALTAWGDRWAQPAEGQPMAFLHRTCGMVFEARVTCSGCGAAIKAGDVTALPGPGGAARPGTMVLAARLRERRAD
jgi:DNA-binding HxlR family transcriptional regulator